MTEQQLQAETAKEFPLAQEMWFANPTTWIEWPASVLWYGYGTSDTEALFAAKSAALQIWPAHYAGLSLEPNCKFPTDKIEQGDLGFKPHSIVLMFAGPVPHPPVSAGKVARPPNHEISMALNSLLKPLLTLEPQVKAAVEGGQTILVEWGIDRSDLYGLPCEKAYISARTNEGSNLRLSLANIMLALLFDELECCTSRFQLRSSFIMPLNIMGPITDWHLQKFASNRVHVLADPGGTLGRVLYSLQAKGRSVLATHLVEVIEGERAVTM